MDINEDRRLLRFSGAAWFEPMTKQTVTLVGCGGIGSFTSLALARLGIERLFLFDPDIIEDVNMAGQFYSEDQIGLNKVAAMAFTLGKYAPSCAVSSFPTRATEETLFTKITMTGLDSMAARKDCFSAWYKANKGKQNSLFVDGRMSATTAQVFAFRGCDEASINKYQEKDLFTKEEADETVCSFKQTTYISLIMAGLMAETLVDYVTKTYVNKFYPLHYFKEYDSSAHSFVI